MKLDAPWRSLLIASLTMTVQNGVLLTFPVVYVTLLEEFHWGRGQGAGIFAVTTLVVSAAGPLFGYPLDTIGPQRQGSGQSCTDPAACALASAVLVAGPGPPDLRPRLPDTA